MSFASSVVVVTGDDWAVAASDLYSYDSSGNVLDAPGIKIHKFGTTSMIIHTGAGRFLTASQTSHFSSFEKAIRFFGDLDYRKNNERILGDLNCPGLGKIEYEESDSPLENAKRLAHEISSCWCKTPGAEAVFDVFYFDVPKKNGLPVLVAKRLILEPARNCRKPRSTTEKPKEPKGKVGKPFSLLGDNLGCSGKSPLGRRQRVISTASDFFIQRIVYGRDPILGTTSRDLERAHRIVSSCLRNPQNCEWPHLGGLEPRLFDMDVVVLTRDFVEYPTLLEDPDKYLRSAGCKVQNPIDRCRVRDYVSLGLEFDKELNSARAKPLACNLIDVQLQLSRYPILSRASQLIGHKIQEQIFPANRAKIRLATLSLPASPDDDYVVVTDVMECPPPAPPDEGSGEAATKTLGRPGE